MGFRELGRTTKSDQQNLEKSDHVSGDVGPCSLESSDLINRQVEPNLI